MLELHAKKKAASPAGTGGQGGDDEKDGFAEMYKKYGRTPPTEVEAAAYSMSPALASFYYNPSSAGEDKRRNVFLGYLIANVDKRIEHDDEKCPTACMSMHGEMTVGSHFIAGMAVDEQRWVFAHELFHWVNRHFPRARKILRDKYQVATVKDIPPMKLGVEFKIFNLAMDCSINQLLDDREDHGFKRPFANDFGITLEGLNKSFRLKMAPSLDMESYYYALIKTPEAQQAMQGAQEMQDMLDKMLAEARHSAAAEQGEGASAAGGEDIADRMGELHSDGVTQTAVDKQQVDDTVRGRSDNPFMTALKGILPKIDKSLKDRDLWKSIVFSSFGDRRSDQCRNAMVRPNRRNEENPYSRTPIRRSAHSVVIIDTSGSVVNDIPVFLGVIDRAAKMYGVTCDIILCTTSVYKTYIGVKRVRSIIDKVASEVQTGGTDLTRAQKYIKDNYSSRKTNVIVITDGETPWDDWDFKTNAVYTHNHSRIPNIARSAVLSRDMA